MSVCVGPVMNWHAAFCVSLPSAEGMLGQTPDLMETHVNKWMKKISRIHTEKSYASGVQHIINTVCPISVKLRLKTTDFSSSPRSNALLQQRLRSNECVDFCRELLASASPAISRD